MRKTGKLKTPPVKPVRKIEVAAKVTKPKILLIATLLAIGITLIVVAVVKFLTVPEGWQTIEAPSGLTDTCVYEFTLQYLLGETEEKTNREKTAVTDLYVEAAGDAYRIFTAYEVKDTKNIYYINHHPGETIEIPSPLYEAFRLLTESDSRALYLGPIYDNNRALLACAYDVEAEDYDPKTNEEVKVIYQQLLGYINDPEHISLELLGGNKVRLKVSQEYRDYAKENGLETFIELDWMRNAFVTDYIAEALTAKGYTNGVLASYDGYVRNLDKTDRSYDYNVYDGTVSRSYRVATMQYTGVSAMIWLRSYPISTDEQLDYYYWSDGRVSRARLDPADGMDKVACSDLVVYSRKLSCAEVLVQAMDVYVADALDWNELGALPGAGVEFVAVKGGELYASDKAVTFTNLKYGDPKYALPGGKE